MAHQEEGTLEGVHLSVGMETPGELEEVSGVKSWLLCSNCCLGKSVRRRMDGL